MAENLDILNTGASLLIKAALLAARFSGRVRRRSLERLATRDSDAKAREILFLKDRVYQLEMRLAILQRPKRRNTPASPATPEKTPEKPESRSIPAWYPNHVWSVDTTKVLCWGLWPIQVLVAIDRFSRKVVCVAPLEGPNAGWIIEALECAMQEHGAPKHMISDQASVFVGDAFAEVLRQWNIKPRFGTVGKHGSIAVTERVIKTLKYEWPKHVPLIKGFDHLTSLCTEFESWYNT